MPEHAGSTHGIDTAAEAHCHAILMLTAVTKLKIRFVLNAAKLSEQSLASAFAFDAAVVGVVPLLAKHGYSLQRRAVQM